MDDSSKLKFSLFFLRITVFLVMLVWTMDKFINIAHALLVYEKFYFMPDLNVMTMYILGGIELVIIIGFLLGAFKFWTYGFVMVIHAISTLSAYNQYTSPYEGPNLLFFAAWPMLAACVTLFLLRDKDTFLAIEHD